MQDPSRYKTRLCFFWRWSACPHGSTCHFAHGHEELRATQDLYKTKLCSYFMETGKCVLGNKCRHAHGEAQLRTSSERIIPEYGNAPSGTSGMPGSMPGNIPGIISVGPFPNGSSPMGFPANVLSQTNGTNPMMMAMMMHQNNNMMMMNQNGMQSVAFNPLQLMQQPHYQQSSQNGQMMVPGMVGGVQPGIMMMSPQQQMQPGAPQANAMQGTMQQGQEQQQQHMMMMGGAQMMNPPPSGSTIAHQMMSVPLMPPPSIQQQHHHADNNAARDAHNNHGSTACMISNHTHHHHNANNANHTHAAGSTTAALQRTSTRTSHHSAANHSHTVNDGGIHCPPLPHGISNPTLVGEALSPPPATVNGIPAQTPPSFLSQSMGGGGQFPFLHPSNGGLLNQSTPFQAPQPCQPPCQPSCEFGPSGFHGAFPSSSTGLPTDVNTTNGVLAPPHMQPADLLAMHHHRHQHCVTNQSNKNNQQQQQQQQQCMSVPQEQVVGSHQAYNNGNNGNCSAAMQMQVMQVMPPQQYSTPAHNGCSAPQHQHSALPCSTTCPTTSSYPYVNNRNGAELELNGGDFCGASFSVGQSYQHQAMQQQQQRDYVRQQGQESGQSAVAGRKPRVAPRRPADQQGLSNNGANTMASSQSVKSRGPTNPSSSRPQRGPFPPPSFRTAPPSTQMHVGGVANLGAGSGGASMASIMLGGYGGEQMPHHPLQHQLQQQQQQHA